MKGILALHLMQSKTFQGQFANVDGGVLLACNVQSLRLHTLNAAS
jgi:hypothetical protein